MGSYVCVRTGKRCTGGYAVGQGHPSPHQAMPETTSPKPTKKPAITDGPDCKETICL